jgi:hemerythrin-like domain-containing protein
MTPATSPRRFLGETGGDVVGNRWRPRLFNSGGTGAKAMARAAFNRQLCRGRSMDLFQLIRQDHLKAKRLFERLAETSGGTQSRPRLFAELKHELELHAEVEEKYFYPALRSHDEAKDLIEEALAEHGDVKAALQSLDQADKESGNWTDQLEELQEDIEHHVEEEETEIFPLAQKLLDPAQLATIAGEIEKAKAGQKAAR